ncbi:LPD7 domain-containing protein, partial [Acinetobacter baumannii]
KSEGAQVAKDLVAIADVRAWGRLRVQGTEDFKRQVWLEASMRGIEVAGFKPTEADKALLIKQQRDASPAEAAQEAAGKAKDVPA